MVIFNQRLAGYLMLSGFVLHGIKKREDDDRKNVFLFKESDEIKLKIDEFKLLKATKM